MTADPAPLPDTRRSGPFFPRIESWRGLAALMVASSHIWQSQWRDSAGQLQTFYAPGANADGPILAALTPYLRLFNNGASAVNAFFVISGFVLALSLVRGPDDLRRSAGKFFISRLFRIYPAVMATVAIFTVVYWTTGLSLSGADFSPLRIVQNALLIDTSINGVMWSLQVEVLATVVIFLTFLLHRWWGSVAVVLLAIVLIVLSFTGSKMRVLGPDLTTLYAFILGMLAFFWGHRLVERASPSWSALGFTGVFVAMCLARPFLGFSSNWAAVVEAILAAVVVAYLAYGALGPLGWLFDHPIVRFYGRISYSFYLLHPLTLLAVWQLPEAMGSVVRSGVPTPLMAIGLTIAIIVAITPLAWLTYQYVERPGVVLGRATLQWFCIDSSGLARVWRNRGSRHT